MPVFPTFQDLGKIDVRNTREGDIKRDLEPTRRAAHSITETAGHTGEGLQAIGKGIQAIGAGIGSALGNMEASSNKLNDATATASWATNYTNLNNEVNHATDPDRIRNDILPRYDSAMGAATTNLNDEQRTLFGAQHADDLARGKAIANNRIFALEGDKEKAGTFTTLTELQKSQVKTDSPEEHSRAIEQSGKAYDALAEKGYITREEAEIHKNKWTRDLSKSWLEGLSPDRRLKVVQQALAEGRDPLTGGPAGTGGQAAPIGPASPGAPAPTAGPAPGGAAPITRQDYDKVPETPATWSGTRDQYIQQYQKDNPGAFKPIAGSAADIGPAQTPGRNAFPMDPDESARPAGISSADQLPDSFYDRMHAIENPRNVTTSNSAGAQGKYQFIPATWKQFGQGDRLDVAQQEIAVRKLTAFNFNKLQTALDRPPTQAELYLAHQQGNAGAVKLIENLDKRAGDVVGDARIRQNGGDPNGTAREFVEMWRDRFDGSWPKPSVGAEHPITGKVSDFAPPDAKRLLETSGSINRAVDDAFTKLGEDRNINRSDLREYLRTGGHDLDPKTAAYCSAFVGAALEHAGLKGANSNLASDYLNWGVPVRGGDVKRGDVLVVTRSGVMPGQQGDHVGFATGKYSANGLVEMISGNTRGGRVATEFINPGAVVARRFDPNGADTNLDTRLAGVLRRDELVDIERRTQGEIDHRTREQTLFANNEKTNVNALIKDDEASIMRTGKGISDITPDRVEASLGQAERAQFEQGRDRSQRYYSQMNGIEQVSSAELQKRLDGLSPVAGQPGFLEAEKMYEKAEKAIDAIKKNRAADPAGAADKIPFVKEKARNASFDRPGSYVPLANARMAAQAQFDIPEKSRIPISNAEADLLIKQIPTSIDKNEAITNLINTVKSSFGEHSEKAMDYILRRYHANEEVRNVAHVMWDKIAAGVPPSKEDGLRLDDALTKADADGATGQINGALPLPEDEDIETLRSDPEKYSRHFDTTFGAGAAATVLGIGQ